MMIQRLDTTGEIEFNQSGDQLFAGTTAFSDFGNTVYAKLAKKDLTFLFSNHGSSVAEQIKHHALMIRRAFLQLAELAHKDEDIAKGVAGLHVQAFVNINKFLQESAEKLPPCPTNGEPYIRIERPSDLDSLASNVESRSAEAAIV